MAGSNHRRTSIVETLESRTFLSAAMTYDALEAGAATAARATARPAIRLDLVALHEFGHSLGLAHSSDPNSIMYPYYNANYTIANFASDSAVTQFRQMYASESTRPWKDALDADGGVTDGDVDLTYSFALDGARMDSGARSNTFSTFNGLFGAGNWQSVFVTALQRWAGASNGELQVRPFDADGIENAVYNFNTPGASENDSRFGDIRIATHRMDGPGNVLAHTYYPPPNGSTAAGDSHYDSSENWVLGSSSTLTTAPATTTPTSQTYVVIIVLKPLSPFSNGPTIGGNLLNSLTGSVVA